MRHVIDVSVKTWDELERLANEGGYVYRGRPSRSKLIEALVEAAGVEVEEVTIEEVEENIKEVDATLTGQLD